MYFIANWSPVLLSCFLCFRRAHIVSHDMGDSILTEILSRHSRAMLPEYFNQFFQSVTFTNGGMIYDLINQRLSQVQIMKTNIYTIKPVIFSIVSSKLSSW